MSLVQPARHLLGFVRYDSDLIEENEMGKAFSMYGTLEMCTQFLLRNLKARGNSEYIKLEDNIKVHFK
jgi:hypothetical protein